MSEIFDLIRNDKDKIFCMADFETESLCLNECRNKPFQISMLKVKNNEIIEEFDFYIKWKQGLNMSSGAAAITRFDPNIILEKGIPPEEVMEVYDKEIRAADYVVGHNISGFDIYINNIFYRLLKKPIYNFIPKMIDTLALAKGIKGNIPFNKENDDFISWQYRAINKKLPKTMKCGLGALGKEFKIEHDENSLHSSLSDIRLNKLVFDKLKYQINI